MRMIPMKSADEYDYLTRWRRYICRHPGDAKRVKRQYNRRVRRMKIEVE